MSTVNEEYKKYKGLPWQSTFDEISPVPTLSREITKSKADMKNPARWNEGTAENPSYVVFPGMETKVPENGVWVKYIYIGRDPQDSQENAGTDIANENCWIRQANSSDIHSAIVGAIVYRGSENYLNLVEAIVNPTIGDMYNIKYTGTSGTEASGMNYACYARYAKFGETEVSEGDSASGTNASNTAVSGTVVFEGNYAFLSVTSGSTTTKYSFNETTGKYFVATQDSEKNPILGKWDAMGNTMENIPTKAELSEGTFVVAKATQADSATSATSAGKLSASRSIDGVKFDGTANIGHYTTCDSTANEDKVVVLSNFNLVEGACVRVKFTYANSKTNPTLTVKATAGDSGEAKAIKLGGQAFTELKTGIIYQFIYDGTYWEVSGGAGLTDEQKAIISATEQVLPMVGQPIEADYPNGQGVGDLGSVTDSVISGLQNNIGLYRKIIKDYYELQDGQIKTTVTDGNTTPVEKDHKPLRFITCNGVKCKYDVVSVDYTAKGPDFTVACLCKGTLVKVRLYNGDPNSQPLVSTSVYSQKLYNSSMDIPMMQTNITTLNARTMVYVLTTSND